MALSAVVSTSALKQLGLSTSEIALLIHQGQRFGNFVRVAQNDNDLFDVLDEDRDAILKRGGLVNASEMEKRWPMMSLIYQGVNIKGKIVSGPQNQSSAQDTTHRKKKSNTSEDEDSFTWVMVAITSALDGYLSCSHLQELLTQVFVELLQRDDDVAPALRIHINRNIESWRSFGCVRGIAHSMKMELRKSISARAMQEAEMADMKRMLVWLLGGVTTVFIPMYSTTFSIAEALKGVSLDLCTNGDPTHEGQACIAHHFEGLPLGVSSLSTKVVPRGLSSKPLQISWPRDNPESMIDALGVGRSLGNLMNQSWQRGKIAAGAMELIGQADGPYGATEEVHYTLHVSDNAQIRKRYNSHIGMLADQGLPADTENICSALEWILQGEPPESSRWLHNHVSQDYLLRSDNLDVVPEDPYKNVYFKYQAFVIGLYYQLLSQLLSFELVEASAFFRGIWGISSTTFLTMCTQLGRCWRRDGRVSRTHILYVLSAMYNGRRKIFNAIAKLPRLIGILGPISVLTLPLVRITDNPKEISKFAIVDLPIVDLVANNADGELMASDGERMSYDLTTEPEHAVTLTEKAGTTQDSKTTQKPETTPKWTVHPCMRIAWDVNGISVIGGVVMAARYGKRLVGFFNPQAADVSFLSAAYANNSYRDEQPVVFDMEVEHWKVGKALRPDKSLFSPVFSITNSHGSPSLRYAAAGLYAERGEDIVIARSKPSVAMKDTVSAGLTAERFKEIVISRSKPPIDPKDTVLAGEDHNRGRRESSERREGIATSSRQDEISPDPAFALSLPLLVDKIFQSLPLAIVEPPVPAGKVRVYWKASGRRMYDDFVELGYGAAEELQRTLQTRYKPTTAAGDGRSMAYKIVQHVLGFFRHDDGDRSQSNSDMETGEQGSSGEGQGGQKSSEHQSGPNPVPDSTSSEQEAPQSEESFVRLLMCEHAAGKKTTLRQQIIDGAIKDDRELFLHLRSQYLSKRSWFTLRSVRSLSLAQFQVNYSNVAIVYRHEGRCPITRGGVDVQDLKSYCFCIPPLESVGEGKEYLCGPSPGNGDKGVVPVLSPKFLMGDFQYPLEIIAGQTSTLNQLPKRRQPEELRATPKEMVTGWGLHIEEDWHWPAIYCCFGVIVLFSLVFGIVWSVVNDDLQGAWAISGYAVSVGVMFIAYILLPGT